jgi:putative SOS response-associated peptidase YedK
MPVILDPGDYDRWLDPATPLEDVRALLKPFPAERMEAHPVSRAVNSVKNDSEALLEPLPDEPPLARRARAG